jgi:hypothetical protein
MPKICCHVIPLAFRLFSIASPATSRSPACSLPGMAKRLAKPLAVGLRQAVRFAGEQLEELLGGVDLVHRNTPSKCFQVSQKATMETFMSRGPGRIERAIEAAFAAELDNAFMIEDLCIRMPGAVTPLLRRHQISDHATAFSCRSRPPCDRFPPGPRAAGTRR